MLTRTLVLPIAFLAVLVWNPLATATDEEQAAEKAAGATSSSVPEVNLLNNGSQPREQLRYTYEAGKERTFLLSSQSTVDRQVAGFPVPTERLPEVQATVVVKVEEIDEDGKAHTRIEYTKVKVVEGGGNPAVSRMMEQTLSEIEGAVIRIVTCDRGLLHEFRLEEIELENSMASQVIGDMHHNLQRLIVPLPEGPIGPGARWQVESNDELTGIESTTRSTFELKRFENDAFEVKLVFEQRADFQKVDFPGSNQEMEMDRMRAETEGTASGRLGFLLPSAADTSTSSESEFAIEINDMPQRIIQRMQGTHSLRDTTDEQKDSEAEESGD